MSEHAHVAWRTAPGVLEFIHNERKELWQKIIDTRQLDDDSAQNP